MQLRALLLSCLLLCAPAAGAAMEAIQAPGPNGPLQGTLLPPSTGSPVILIIPGSGPTDRDGNNPLGIKAAPYRLLAEGLAQEGIGSVRIDKRGMFASLAVVPDANAVTIGDYVADIGAWVKAARQRTGVSCVWLLGHSEGGLVALAAARTPDVCGLILIATAGRTTDALIREQLRANPANGPLLPAADKTLDSLKEGRRVPAGDVPPPLMALFAPQIQGFMISLMAHDPAALAAQADKPLLIIQGDRDIQVTVADAQRLKAAAPAAALSILPGMNHVLKTVDTDDRRANIATYADPHLPLAAGLVDMVAAFVRR